MCGPCAWSRETSTRSHFESGAIRTWAGRTRTESCNREHSQAVAAFASSFRPRLSGKSMPLIRADFMHRKTLTQKSSSTYVTPTISRIAESTSSGSWTWISCPSPFAVITFELRESLAMSACCAAFSSRKAAAIGALCVRCHHQWGEDGEHHCRDRHEPACQTALTDCPRGCRRISRRTTGQGRLRWRDAYHLTRDAEDCRHSHLDGQLLSGETLEKRIAFCCWRDFHPRIVRWLPERGPGPVQPLRQSDC